jgi:hypothetical protein
MAAPDLHNILCIAIIHGVDDTVLLLMMTANHRGSYTVELTQVSLASMLLSTAHAW